MKSSLNASEANSYTKEVAEGKLSENIVVDVQSGALSALLSECVLPSVMSGKFQAEIPYSSRTLNDMRRHGYLIVSIGGSRSVAQWDDTSLASALEYNKSNDISRN